MLAPYSEFQVNKVPESKAKLSEYPKLYELFINQTDYQNIEVEDRSLPEKERVKPLTDKERKLQMTLLQLSNQYGSVLQSAS